MNKSINIQDTFLNQLRKESIPVTVFLTNGFQIRGTIKAFDNFTIVIDSDGRQQMVYKHAISTFQPQRNVSLMQESAGEV
ncbi:MULTISPECIES: RNA chaperone Hfq [unclassified Paenibacillus]|uniref:RNA chaperone Hfq n=1 Tax=unclassified Paenibacillus TaxID=185978 RepID=UPI000837C7BD|nr:MULTISPECIES: RNA chaperone Hfq [unclassified Paenibacillus]NWL90381.1 RNA chaperone Hfq [Paenibacillus sp. 79R4]